MMRLPRLGTGPQTIASEVEVLGGQNVGYMGVHLDDVAIEKAS